MTGETDLSVLLGSMEPQLRAEAYVFCSMPSDRVSGTLMEQAAMMFREQEAVTLILTKESAEAASQSWESEWAWITLNVHSSLEAVGFLAQITSRLAEKGIPVNAVSAYFHDHLFVPFGRRHQALHVVKELGKEAP